MRAAGVALFLFLAVPAWVGQRIGGRDAQLFEYIAESRPGVFDDLLEAHDMHPVGKAVARGERIELVGAPACHVVLDG